MRSAIRRANLVCPLTLVATGCVASQPRPVVVAPQSACTVSAAPAVSPESIVVATWSPIDAAHAPFPRGPGERFAFAQLYETLINADCDGRAYPGLARSWTTDASKTRITLVLRDDARFWDGTALVASDVIGAWRTTAVGSTEGSQLARRLADATTIADDRTLIVSLPDTQSLVLASPALAVSRRRGASEWPEGSAPYRIAENAPAPGTIAITPIWPHRGPRLVVRLRRDTDARDEIDAGVDLLLTADPTALSYATTRPDLTSIPLPWDRAYLLAVPAPGGASLAVAQSGGDAASAFRASLARDAVRAEARAAEPPFWWQDGAACASRVLNDAPPPDRRRVSRVVYPREDRVAREIAERLVAVGGLAASAGLAPADFAEALRNGGDMAYVVTLPHRPLAPCEEFATLRSTIPWIFSGALSPLVDTRHRAIMRRDQLSAIIDWDGTLRMTTRAGGP